MTFAEPSDALLWLALGYLSGSIPFGVLAARAFGLGDLRKVGSGNIGATNVLRTGNQPAAAASPLRGMAKGWAPVFAAGLLAGEGAAAFAALGAVLGHVFPVWLRFRGGKGVATFLGVLLGLAPLAGALGLLSWLGFAALFRISSLAALLMTLTAPAWLWLAGAGGALWALAILVPLIWIMHRENIARLLRGEEPRIGKT